MIIEKIILSIVIISILCCSRQHLEKRNRFSTADLSAKKSSTASGNAATTLDPDTRGKQLELHANVAIRNFEQAFATMTAVTGVTANTQIPAFAGRQATSIITEFLRYQDQLPENNDVQSFQGAHQLATIKLAAEFCQVLGESNSPTAFGTLAFSMPPNQSLSSINQKRDLVSQITNTFWGKSVAFPGRDDSTAILASLLDELLVGSAALQTPDRTKNIAKAVCTAALASAPSMMF